MFRNPSLACVAGLLASSIPLWSWGNDGHQIVARIAALNLTPKARRNVARLLGTPANSTAVADAMARAAVWPDTFLRSHFPDSKPWHFIDICRSAASGADLAQFCPQGQCITTKIEEYRKNIPASDFDQWGGKGDVSLLIHFLGDIHQPLHCATNADRGGNCLSTTGSHSNNLHSVWDNDVVQEVESGTSVAATAEQLNEDFQDHPDTDRFSWQTGSSADIARESRAVAEKEIYSKVGIPIQTCVVDMKSCNEAPQAVQDFEFRVDPSYLDEAAATARMQLTRAGLRLAALLNAMWP